MEKRDSGAAEGWRQVLEVLRGPGLLLATTDADGKPNVMTIGWAQLGIGWGKPIVTVLMRPSRNTYAMLEAVPDFTINVPTPAMDDLCQYCGTVSGRDEDKFRRPDLTAVASRHVESPVIDECVLHYECRVVHKNDGAPETLSDDILTGAYASGDFHRIYSGEVLAVYGAPDFEARIARVGL